MGEKGGDLAVRFDASLPGDFEVDTTIRKGNDTRVVKYRILSLPMDLVERLDEVVASQMCVKKTGLGQ